MQSETATFVGITKQFPETIKQRSIHRPASMNRSCWNCPSDIGTQTAIHVDRRVSGNVVASDTLESRVFPGGCIPVGADSTEQTSRGNSLTQRGQKQLESTVQKERGRERERSWERFPATSNSAWTTGEFPSRDVRTDEREL